MRPEDRAEGVQSQELTPHGLTTPLAKGEQETVLAPVKTRRRAESQVDQEQGQKLELADAGMWHMWQLRKERTEQSTATIFDSLR